MAYTISQFANDTTPALPDLDQNFNAVFVLTPIPCSVSGTDALTMTQNAAGQAASGVITALANGLQICGIAVQTNTGNATVIFGALGPLTIFKDTVAGTASLTGGEIVQGCAFTLRYSSAINGWHLITSMAIGGSTITPALVRASVGLQLGATTTPTLTGLITGGGTLAFTALVPNASQDQTFTVAGLLSTDGLAMSMPLPNSTGLTFSSYFAAGNTVTGTVTVRCANITAASTITPGTITVGLKGFRSV
jgi:hypothetical protein